MWRAVTAFWVVWVASVVATQGPPSLPPLSPPPPLSSPPPVPPSTPPSPPYIVDGDGVACGTAFLQRCLCSDLNRLRCNQSADTGMGTCVPGGPSYGQQEYDCQMPSPPPPSPPPPPPQAPSPPSPPLQVVQLQLLQQVVGSVSSDGTKSLSRRAFELQFAADVAAAIELPPYRVVVSNVIDSIDTPEIHLVLLPADVSVNISHRFLDRTSGVVDTGRIPVATSADLDALISLLRDKVQDTSSTLSIKYGNLIDPNGLGVIVGVPPSPPPPAPPPKGPVQQFRASVSLNGLSEHEQDRTQRHSFDEVMMRPITPGGTSVGTVFGLCVGFACLLAIPASGFAYLRRRRFKQLQIEARAKYGKYLDRPRSKSPPEMPEENREDVEAAAKLFSLKALCIGCCGLIVGAIYVTVTYLFGDDTFGNKKQEVREVNVKGRQLKVKLSRSAKDIRDGKLLLTAVRDIGSLISPLTVVTAIHVLRGKNLRKGTLESLKSRAEPFMGLGMRRTEDQWKEFIYQLRDEGLLCIVDSPAGEVLRLTHASLVWLAEKQLEEEDAVAKRGVMEAATGDAMAASPKQVLPEPDDGPPEFSSPDSPAPHLEVEASQAKLFI